MTMIGGISPFDVVIVVVALAELKLSFVHAAVHVSFF